MEMDQKRGRRLQGGKEIDNRYAMPCTFCNPDSIVTTAANRTGRGKTLWQNQIDCTIRPTAFASRYSNDTTENYSSGELDLIAVV